MIWAYLINNILKYILILIRMASFVITMPILGGRTLPSRYKAGMAAIFSLIVFPFVKYNTFPHSFLLLVLLIIEEVLLGLLLSLLTNIIFGVFAGAGRIMGMQIGFGMVNVIDPYSENRFTIMDAFLYFFAVLIFFVINGHHILIKAIILSFEKIPIGGLFISPSFGREIVREFSWMFAFSLLIALPIISTILIIHIALGIVAKTSPKIQVFILSFPIKIGVGLIMLSIIFPSLSYLIAIVYKHLYETLTTAIGLLV